jgi:RimJ/RimL family protein N-acetyltransferase
MPVVLETARLRLRPWEASDAEALHALWAERDPRSLRVLDAEGRPTVDDLRANIADQVAATSQSGLALLAADRRLEGDFIGYCGLIVGRASHAEPEIAFELFRRVHNQGYATEAASAVIAAAAETGRTRLWSTVRVWNAPSLRVLEKLGFVRSNKVDKDPDRGDTVWLTRSLPTA